MIYPAALTLALVFALPIHALPQGSPRSSDTSDGDSDPWSPPSSPYMTTTSPYSTNYPTTTPYPPTTTPYPPTTTKYPPTTTKYPTTTPYPPTTTPYSTSYPTTSIPYYPTTTPYSTSYPTTTPYTTSIYPPKQSYPPTTTPYPPVKPSTPTPSPLRATFDNTFDNKDGSLNGVACSNGENGLASRFPTFGDLPSFPFIGGAFDVVWNSPNCGSCWAVTNPANGVTINITAIDTAGAGFNIAKEAFDKLAGAQSFLGAIDVKAKKISPSVCGW